MRRIYREFEEGNSLSQISENLNRDGIRTRRGSKWTKDNLSTILHNPIYAGYMRWETVLVRHFAIPAVNPVDYNRVQELAASRARNPARKNAELVPEETSPARLDIDDFGDVTNN